MSVTFPDQQHPLRPTTAEQAANGLPTLGVAVEHALHVASFPFVVSMAPWRQKWEALQALLRGRQPVLGQMTASDIPFVTRAESARLLPKAWQKEVCFQVERKGKGLCLYDQKSRTEAHFGGDELFTVLGPLVHEAAIADGHSEAFYREILLDFLRMCRFNGTRADLLILARWLGVPQKDWDEKKVRFEQGNLRQDHPFGRAFYLLKGASLDHPPGPWFEISISAERIHTYLAKFHSNGLRRGASAMVADYLACLRDGLVAKTSIGCLLQDLGGSLLFILPGTALAPRPAEMDARQAAEVMVRMLGEVREAALRAPDGFFFQRYPLGAAEAERASLAHRGLRLRTWGARGLFPDTLVRVRKVEDPGAWVASSGHAPMQDAFHEAILWGDQDLNVSPPRTMEPRCFGCRVEQGLVDLPWWPGREKLCPMCALVATANRRTAELALEGASEDPGSCFRSCLIAPWRKDCAAVTIFLDGCGVGTYVAEVPVTGRWQRALAVEGEVRARYRSGVREVERCCSSAPDGPPRGFPIEINFFGGDDVCLMVEAPVAVSFLRGFFAAAGGLKWAGAVLSHSAALSEVVRVRDVLVRLMKSAKQAAVGRDGWTLAVGRLRPLEELQRAGEECAALQTEGCAHDLDTLQTLLDKLKS